MLNDISDAWAALSAVVKMVVAGLLGLFAFFKSGGEAINVLKQLPDLVAMHRAEEVRQNQEQARSIVHLATIDACFTIAKSALLVLIYLVQMVALTKLALAVLSSARADREAATAETRRKVAG